MQIQCKNDIVRMIRDVTRPTLMHPRRLEDPDITVPNGTMTKGKVDEMDIEVWKKDYEKVHQKANFKKKKKGFPIILGQCSPLK